MNKQKILGHNENRRYFWNVSLADGSRIVAYRSRCATAAGVRAQFKKKGVRVTGVGKSTTA